MWSKEREVPEKVYFLTESVWHVVPREQATGSFSELDLKKGEDVRQVWMKGPGRGMSTEAVIKRIEERTKKELDPEKVKNLPSGSWITRNGKIHLKGSKLCYTKHVIISLLNKLRC